jgi:hypothetical protein
MTAAGRECLPSSVHHRALRCRALLRQPPRFVRPYGTGWWWCKRVATLGVDLALPVPQLPRPVHGRRGTFFAATGSFTIAVTEGPPPVRIVGPDAPQRNPTLDFLRKKPLRASDYLNRAH